jgi:protein-tyrosine-phosphatase
VKDKPEVGSDLSRELPKPLTDASVEAADVVITMGSASSVTRSTGASGNSSPSWFRRPARPDRAVATRLDRRDSMQ